MLVSVNKLSSVVARDINLVEMLASVNKVSGTVVRERLLS
jgi:hypothetical protein